MSLSTEFFSPVQKMENAFSFSSQFRLIGRVWLLRNIVELRPQPQKRLLLLISALFILFFCEQHRDRAWMLPLLKDILYTPSLRLNFQFFSCLA